MEIDISEKGKKYLEKSLKEEFNFPAHDESSWFENRWDVMILTVLSREGPQELESFIKGTASGGGRVRKVVRRLFEEGYIEEAS